MDFFLYERCVDCGAEVYVDCLDDGFCAGCALADVVEGWIVSWGVSSVVWDVLMRFVWGE